MNMLVPFVMRSEVKDLAAAVSAAGLFLPRSVTGACCVRFIYASTIEVPSKSRFGPAALDD